uniref:Uncharacterized protein n=1 Tax=Arundo donax TaxID=35708 RepID=A0A0A9AK95_ARUDO
MLLHCNPHAPSFLFHKVSCACMDDPVRSRRKKRQEGQGRCGGGSSRRLPRTVPRPCPVCERPQPCSPPALNRSRRRRRAPSVRHLDHSLSAKSARWRSIEE